MQRKPYFYDAQLKRILIQLMSCFAGYQVQTGVQRDGKAHFRSVPVLYGDMSRVAAFILNGDDQVNVVSHVPVMAVYMTGLSQDPMYRHGGQITQKFIYTERAMDQNNELIAERPGIKKTVETNMPVPYKMNIELSIWASNNDEGYQLVEQIATMFNPSVEVQWSESMANQAAVSELFFDGDIRMEKASPAGADMDPLYVFSLPFSITIQLSPPAKVYDSKVIYHIHVPIYDMEEWKSDGATAMDELVIDASDDEIMIYESLNSKNSMNGV